MIALAAVALLATMAFCMIAPTAEAADGQMNTYADIRADSYTVGTGKTIVYTIYASGGSEDIKFAASLKDSSDNTVNVPSSGGKSSVDMKGVDLTITAPADAGMYTLFVEFTYTDADDEKVSVTKTAPVKVVNPVKLTAVMDNTTGGTIYNMNVWFEVDGVKVEGSDQNNITINANSTKSVTYDWVVEDLSKGKHKVTLRGYVGPNDKNAEGLLVFDEFYIGQNDYTLMEAVLVIVFIVLLILLLVVYRKPVKNLGKPKGRR